MTSFVWLKIQILTVRKTFKQTMGNTNGSPEENTRSEWLNTYQKLTWMYFNEEHCILFKRQRKKNPKTVIYFLVLPRQTNV